jgi:hypothetical protein
MVNPGTPLFKKGGAFGAKKCVHFFYKQDARMGCQAIDYSTPPEYRVYRNWKIKNSGSKAPPQCDFILKAIALMVNRTRHFCGVHGKMLMVATAEIDPIRD